MPRWTIGVHCCAPWVPSEKHHFGTIEATFRVGQVETSRALEFVGLYVGSDLSNKWFVRRAVGKEQVARTFYFRGTRAVCQRTCPPCRAVVPLPSTGPQKFVEEQLPENKDILRGFGDDPDALLLRIDPIAENLPNVAVRQRLGR